MRVTFGHTAFIVYIKPDEFLLLRQTAPGHTMLAFVPERADNLIQLTPAHTLEKYPAGRYARVGIACEPLSFKIKMYSLKFEYEKFPLLTPNGLEARSIEPKFAVGEDGTILIEIPKAGATPPGIRSDLFEQLRAA